MRRLAALLLWMSAAACAATFQGRVSHVSDGDTVVVRSGTRSHTIRLINIDAPEMDQPGGRESRRALQGLVRAETVTVRTRGRDKYGRTLALIERSRDGLPVNLELVRLGHAWTYTRGASRPLFQAAEAEARAARIGLWQDPAPIRPDRWRRRHDRVPRSDAAPPPMASAFVLQGK